MSRAASGGQGNSNSRFGAISPDGRFVVFQSGASNLVPGDTNAKFDVFVRDRLSGTTERVSLPLGGGEANGTSDSGVISANGRFVAFRSDAFNLTGGESNPFSDIFVRDRVNGTTERISAPQGFGLDGDSFDLAMSADGRFVAFDSRASNLVPGDTNDRFDIFVRDRLGGFTHRISIQGGQANGDSLRPAISADGRYVAFDSTARNLTLLDTNGVADIFVRDQVNGTTELVSIPQGGGLANGNSTCRAISGDGRFVVFESSASNLVPGDTNGRGDIFVRDRIRGITERVSLATSGLQGNGDHFSPAISDDGRFVTFLSNSSNLVPGDTNGTFDVFLRDRARGTTELVNLSQSGSQANLTSGTFTHAISADGRFVAFHSFANNLVSGDTNNTEDVFVRDRGTVADVQLSVADAQVSEGTPRFRGEPVVNLLAFRVSLSAPTSQNVTFDFWTEDLSARSGSDYQRTFGTATIPAGSTSAIINVPVIADFNVEPNEQMHLNIDMPINASIVRGQATGSILDDDFTFTLTVGTFELAPPEATIEVKERLTYELTWTVPSSSWLDLDTIEMRIGENGSLLWLRFDETSRTLSLYNPAKRGFGSAFAPGSPNVLSSGAAKLYLDESAIITEGPASPQVTLLLTVGFGPTAIGENYPVEIGATNDDGEIQPFELGGILSIVPKNK